MRALSLTLAIALIGITRAPAEDWVIGYFDPNEEVTQTTDRVVDGNIYILNNGRLNVEGAAITVFGSIYVVDAAALDVAGGSIRFMQQYAYQRQFVAADAATLRFADGVVNGDGRSYSIGLAGTATASFERVTVENGFATWGLWDDATLAMKDCTNAGEFVPLGQNELTISNSDTVLFWMTLPDGSVVDVALPPPGEVDAWSIGPDSSWAEGIPYSATLSSCTNVWWGVMAQSGCDGTFRDSTLRVVGSYFDRDNEFTIRGMANHQFLADSAYAWGDVALRFINSEVQTWSYYCNGSTKLTLEACLFGELLAAESGEARVIGSLCDGSGGYMGAFGNAQLWMFNSTNLSQTTSAENALLLAYGSALLSPAIDATGDSVMVLLNTQYFGNPAAHDSAAILDAAIDPVDAAAGQRVALRGSARMLTGPDSLWVYEGYSLEYGIGSEPSEWFPISNPSDDMVRDGALGSWSTRGLNPGTYALRVSIHHNAGEPAPVSSPASLAPPPILPPAARSANPIPPGLSALERPFHP